MILAPRLKEITFDEIFPIWRNELWPERISPIEPVSVMMFLGGFDMNVQFNTPTFFAATIDGEIAGVNSGVTTARSLYRSRGLYVRPQYRGQGVAQELLGAVTRQGRMEGCTAIWSMPRQSAIRAYLRSGFYQVSEWFDEGVETGPNCYVVRQA